MLFLTPQTLINDIESKICPCERVVCIVIDEAHKASGKHAYAQAVKLLSRKSGGFRILALSATPGQTLDRIQEIVTNLRIHRFEARDETSIDVIGCLNERVQETRVLPLSGPVLAARDAVGRVYERTLRKLQGFGGFYETDITKLSRYVLVQAQQRYSSVRPEGVPAHIHFRNCAGFTIAVMMAQAYELVSAYGCGSCLSFLSAYLAPEGEGASDDDSDAEDGAAPKRKAGQSKAAAGKAKPRGGHMVQQERMSLFSSAEFEQMIGLVQRAEEGASHPKLAATVELLNDHFGEHGEKSRVMVFTTFRSAVGELMKRLKDVRGIRAQRFIGQSAGKGEFDAKGMPQKEQRQVVRQFREGEYNVLVATSIGEEGLDIGEVDLIICYDALGSATRTTGACLIV